MNKLVDTLVSGRDYPRNFSQFSDWFCDEQACLRYLERLRWPAGFVCPACGKSGEPYRSSRSRLVCRACRHQCTATAGTIFDKTRTPLRTWFAAIWYLTSQKFGVSALGLQQTLGLGSYQTSWAMLHRLRRAMVRPGRERLHGPAEVDAAYVGARNSRQRRRRAGKNQPTLKTLVAVAIEIEIQATMGFGQIRLRRIPSRAAEYLVPFVCEMVEPGARIDTDGSMAYLSLTEHGYEHCRHVQLGADDPAHVSMPGVHQVASLLQRWLQGTHQGAVRAAQLDYYLDEFSFRFNHRNLRSRGLLFYRLLEQAVATPPVTYRRIVARNA